MKEPWDILASINLDEIDPAGLISKVNPADFHPEYEVEHIPWYQKVLLNILKMGPIPNHIAFIMDGNRRWARSNNRESVLEGHRSGFEKMVQVVSWLYQANVKEATMYAFSIENFNRPKEEVDGLINLMRNKFNYILDERANNYFRYVRISFIGDKSLLPQDVQEVMHKIECQTIDNCLFTLNLAMPYTCRHDMVQAVNQLLQIENNNNNPYNEVFSMEEVQKLMWTSRCSKVDIMVRTSGEVRFSDFMMLESGRADLEFLDVLWPDLSVMDLIGVLFRYQRCYLRQLPNFA